MDLNAILIDQQAGALAERFAGRFAAELGIKNDPAKARSAAFVLLTIRVMLDLTDDEAFDCLTEGANDFGVDAIHVGPIHDGEFAVTLVQGKYKQKLDGVSAFPETGVTKAIQAVAGLFDPDRALTLNDSLRANIEEVRSRIRDGHIPQVRFILCNNGPKWTDVAQALLDQTGFGKQVVWEHVNHDQLVAVLQAVKAVDDTVRLSGKATIEDFAFRRVLVGRVSVAEVAALFDRHGDRLLERNIRRYLGLQGNRVNEAIAVTLGNPSEHPNFYFYNNGITLTCSQFQHNALQQENWQVRVQGLQIINGGQTCRTIQEVLRGRVGTAPDAHVLVRIYELPRGEEDLVRSITYATNSQNPVDLRDLKSNDERQRALELSIEPLGYHYLRQRGSAATQRTDITSGTAAEAVLAVWREKPHQARFMPGEHFGRLYNTIFTERLNGAQVVLAVRLFRITESRRKRPPQGAPEFARYASCFTAMLMGRSLLKALGIKLEQLDHRRFAEAESLIDANSDKWLADAEKLIAKALDSLYGQRSLSLQQLSATFRRGDLMSYLPLV